MKSGGRISAAIAILEDISERRTPVNNALRDWGKSHRFAGSKDRAFIGALVLDTLRKRSSVQWRMDAGAPRALVLGTLVYEWGEDPASLAKAFLEDRHSPEKLSEREKKFLARPRPLESAGFWVQADIPEWIWPAFENNFTADARLEGQALAARAPLDLRVNTLKTRPESVVKTLAGIGFAPTALSPVGFRAQARTRDRRVPNIQTEAMYLTGEVEIQDEGSQLVSLLMDARPGEKILDYCAGGGGKTLALAAGMQNEGRLYAYDIDRRRLAPLYARAQRAGAANIEILLPPAHRLKALTRKMDRVLVDTPCSGSGTWRRKPDAKWRLSRPSLGIRLKEQKTVLGEAKKYVRPGGLLFYVTCSVFAEENEGQVYAFLEENPEFELLSAGETWEEKFGVDKYKPWSEDGCTITLTPASTQTDGFFFAVLERIK